MRSTAHIRRALALLAAVAIAAEASAASSLRFFGKAIGNVNRVMVRIDPHVPADVGATDFTVEFWMKANAVENVSNGGCSTGSGENWITGNIIIDRAIWEHDRHGEYGISMFRNGGGSRLAFGVFKSGSFGQGICGTRNVGDGQWHHVAVTRAVATGVMRIYVDGQLDAQGSGPPGDISYANGVPSRVPPYIRLDVDNYLGIGAEKYDADGTRYPSYSGFLDEIRISNILRYTASFVPPSQPFVPDANTAALWHFDEGSGNVINDSAPGGGSPGERRFGGNPAGPQWSSETPFAPSSNPGTLAFAQAGSSIGESAGAATITVNRTGGSSGSASVSYQTSGGSATPGSDYSGASGTLTWASGDANPKTFTIIVNDDAVDEADETVEIDLTAATGAALGSPSSAALTILDDDATAVPGTLQFSAATYDTAEGAGSVAVTVTRSGGTDGAVSVSYATANGTAAAGSDFTSASGTLSWPAGDASPRSIVVPIVNDATAESGEVFSLTLFAPQGGASLGTRSSASVSIADDDSTGPPSGYLDAFDRADHPDVGNGWTEQHPGAFALAAGRVAKRAVAVSGDTVVYRPAAENVQDAEASVELRVDRFPAGYPQVFVRLQTGGLGTNNALVRYVLFVDDSPGRAVLARQRTSGGFTQLAALAIAPQLNTIDTYRLRLRAVGRDPVQLSAAIERLAGGTWQPIGSTTVVDSSAERIRDAGSTGFGGYTEASYSYDNFQRTGE